MEDDTADIEAELGIEVDRSDDHGARLWCSPRVPKSQCAEWTLPMALRTQWLPFPAPACFIHWNLTTGTWPLLICAHHDML